MAETQSQCIEMQIQLNHKKTPKHVFLVEFSSLDTFR